MTTLPSLLTRLLFGTTLLGSLCFLSQCQNASDNSQQKNADSTQTAMQFPEIPPIESIDVHSFAQPQKARLTQLALDVSVDFETKTIAGVAAYQIEAAAGEKEIIFDTKDLTIEAVTDKNGNALQYVIGEKDDILGAPLRVTFQDPAAEVHIRYRSSSKAEALQWLEPQQTQGKKEPFLFTQSQAILARTWIPIQDSPGIRFTYTAKVSVPKQLLAVMSATNPTEKNSEGVYTFEMKQPIPAYLMALSVGDIVFEKVGNRTGVYAEPATLKAAVYEFAEMEQMLEAAEKLYGTYAWERYDLIVLPPSFPFGGMENPRLTFATPTILAGDRSLTALVAHELAHSWSGNLVTTHTWDDFWLNEGFTVYFENRIMEAVYGKEYADMLALISYLDLKETVEEYEKEGKSEDTKLKLDLKGRNPDDGVSAIAYDKGFFFLKRCEEVVGREGFDEFLSEYFKTFAFKTIDTKTFVFYLETRLLAQYPEAKAAIEAEKWIYQAGIPENIPQISSKSYQTALDAAQAFEKGSEPQALQSQYETEKWRFQQWVFFLRNLPQSLSEAQMKSLDATFGFTKMGNSEILAVWLAMVAKNEYKPAYVQMESFLMQVGRRKFIVPIYKMLMEKQSTQPLAKQIYKKARPNYHPVAVLTLDELVK
ncbi:M1 family metallopeptidase [Hugenholtzia roseola]|uniref:M1 family metallopeptidase n=1 Tax=Hugenholtzia roseola TaxID=1002 RepID=UPI00055000E3|nr:M1 family metallopeptidase [Hugenholtzia roseola]